MCILRSLAEFEPDEKNHVIKTETGTGSRTTAAAAVASLQADDAVDVSASPPEAPAFNIIEHGP